MDLDAARPYIEAALLYAKGSHTFEDVKADVEDGVMQFWPGVHSAIITEIIAYPRYRVLNFFLAGGNRAELEAMYPGIEQWGKANGCTRAAMLGRPFERHREVLDVYVDAASHERRFAADRQRQRT